jgi:hypothetical protein
MLGVQIADNNKVVMKKLTGTVTSVGYGVGMYSTTMPNPITTTGTLGVDSMKVVFFNDTLKNGTIATQFMVNNLSSSLSSDFLMVNDTADLVATQYDLTQVGGSGTVTSISQGTGMLNSVNPLTTTGTIGVDTTKVVMFTDTLTAGKIQTKHNANSTYVLKAEIKPLCGTGVDTTAINKDDKFLLGYSEGIVIDTIVYILQRRAGSPDITAVISYGKDISAAGTALIAAGSNITSYTTATKVSAFDGTPSISPGNMIWMTLPTITVSPRSIHVVLIGHRL